MQCPTDHILVSEGWVHAGKTPAAYVIETLHTRKACQTCQSVMSTAPNSYEALLRAVNVTIKCSGACQGRFVKLVIPDKQTPKWRGKHVAMQSLTVQVWIDHVFVQVFKVPLIDFCLLPSIIIMLLVLPLGLC